MPDRTAKTLAAWLKAHPGVEILSRDRSKTYKRGISQGAPNAIQVADRFHLLQKLEETLESVFKGYIQTLQAVEREQLQAEPIVVAPPPEPLDNRQSQKAMNRTRRLEKYEQTHALRKQGYAIKDIAHHLGIGERTVYTCLAASTFPERQPTIRKRGSGLVIKLKSAIHHAFSSIVAFHQKLGITLLLPPMRCTTKFKLLRQVWVSSF